MFMFHILVTMMAHCMYCRGHYWSLTPDAVQDVGPAPRVVSQELGVLDGGLAELAPQVRCCL